MTVTSLEQLVTEESWTSVSGMGLRRALTFSDDGRVLVGLSDDEAWRSAVLVIDVEQR